jgi:hypothetical protein
MSHAFQAHLEILPEAQWRLWPELRPTLQLGFVLYGGTAIALRLGHGSSVDFDFFTDQPLDRIAIHTAFPFLDRSQVLQDQPDTFTVVAPCGDSHDHPVKVSFFGALGFGWVGEPELTHDRVLQGGGLPGRFYGYQAQSVAPACRNQGLSRHCSADQSRRQSRKRACGGL